MSYFSNYFYDFLFLTGCKQLGYAVSWCHFLMFLVIQFVERLGSLRLHFHFIYKFLSLFLQVYFFVPHSLGSITTHVRPMEVDCSLLMLYFIFYPFIFPLRVTLEDFYCYIFKFTKLFAMLNFMLIFSVFFISGSSIYVFHVSSMSLLNMLNFSSTFLNVQDTVIMTVLISLSNWFYICVISGHTLIISLFPSL